MKKILIAALLLLAAPLSQAQVTSTSGSSVQTSSAAGANNQGNSLTNNFEAGDRMHYDYGHQRIEQVAPLALGGAAAGFSNENCANTAQLGGGTFWFNAAKADPKESIRCNARRDAGVFTALAADNDASGNRQDAASLRQMAKFAICSSTDAYVEACRNLHLVGNDSQKNAAETDHSVKLPPVDVIPSRPAGWTNESMIDKRKAPSDGRSVDPTHNP